MSVVVWRFCCGLHVVDGIVVLSSELSSLLLLNTASFASSHVGNLIHMRFNLTIVVIDAFAVLR